MNGVRRSGADAAGRLDVRLTDVDLVLVLLGQLERDRLHQPGRFELVEIHLLPVASDQRLGHFHPL